MNISNKNVHDHQLWQSYKQGDKDAFGELFQRYYSSLFQFGSKLAADHQLLEDVIQELFIELWQNKKDVEIISVKAYLLKALKYKLFRALQKKGPVLFSDSTDAGIQFSHEFAIISEEEKTERHIKMANALNQLPARQKEIIYLKYYQELSYEDVSEIMNINYQAARNLLYQSVKALKKMLAGISFLLLFAT